MKGRLGAALAAVVLLGAGFLLGAFWVEWRGVRLEAGGPGRSAVEGTPLTLPDGWEVRPRVEVLNGMGRPDAARRAADRLREMGFDVVYFGNADRFDHARTVVLGRSGREAAAARVADSLGIPERVERRPEPELYLDATVVLGADWPSLAAARDSLRSRRGLWDRIAGWLPF